jgi:probable phosphoglycerate mutase
MRLYIIRHGDPDYKNDCLTERGRQEAETLAELLCSLHLTHIYTSPLGRALETAKPAASRLSLPDTVLPWVRELTGIYYDVPDFGQFAPFSIPGEVLYRISPVPQYEGWDKQKYFNDPAFRLLIDEMSAGSDALLAAHGYVREDALYRCECPNEDQIAVFCHQGIGTTWLAYLLHFPYQAAWAGLWQACTSITTIHFEHHSPFFAVPRMIGMGETPHIVLANMTRTECGLKSNAG